ncbi:MAG: hypothetical protein Q9198_005148 [Flavoplaca austrocitrina]
MSITEDSTQDPDQPQRRYQYSTLKDGQIRLLKLKTTEGSASGSRIDCELMTVGPLSAEDDSLPQYEALSYVWGLEPANCQIQLDNDYRFPIKPNLHAALIVLSKKQTERLLWVDAICINQSDNAEKNSQVQMMQEIYQQAHGVLVWINSPGSSVDHNRDAQTTSLVKGFTRAHKAGLDPRRLAQFLDDPDGRMTFRDVSGDSVVEGHGEDGGHWSTVVRFFDHDWWRRVWVRQEIAVSQRATVLCGDLTIDWEDVAALSHWLKVFTNDLDNITRDKGASHRSGAYSGEDLQNFRQTLSRGGDLDLQTMLVHARDCEATDPRDRVFAILGMVEDSYDAYGASISPISVDYNLSPAEVAKRAFRKVTEIIDGLDALIFSQNPLRESGIPSWAPNIRSGFRAQPSRLGDRSTSIYMASNTDRWGFFHFPDTPDTLSMDVRIFDVVEELSQPFAAGLMSSDLDDTMRAAREKAFQWMGDLKTGHKYEQLMRTITRDRDTRGRRLPRNNNTNGVDWTRFFRIEHTGVGAKAEFQYLSAALGQFRAASGAADTDAESQAWLRVYSESIGNRRLALTRGGRLGLVPAESECTDDLCTSSGLDVPLVLRKIDRGTYIVIGEAFVFGMMDGQAYDSKMRVEGVNHWIQRINVK